MVSELTKTAIGLFFDILDVLISLLPNAPFAAMLATLSNDSGIPVLGYVNYFIPFKFCATCINIWLAVYLPTTYTSISDRQSMTTGQNIISDSPYV